jgi:2-hydroxycyclohexanecarboxyl-CoA dehydrogenase
MSESAGLNGRASLVFGGTYGIGAAVARSLVSSGSAVAVSGRNERADLLAELRSGGGRAEFFAGDLNSWGDVDAVVKRTVDAFGRLDVLVVSGRPRGTSSNLFLETDPESFIEYFRSRTVSRLFAARAAAPYMKEQGEGRIIFVTSDAGRVPTPAEVLDGASSAAVVFATRALGRELSRHGIRVNTVALTLTRDTPAYERFTANQDPDSVLFRAFQKIEGRSPFGLNRPEDIAELVVFLAGDGARQISGATISVNGGLSFPG